MLLLLHTFSTRVIKLKYLKNIESYLITYCEIKHVSEENEKLMSTILLVWLGEEFWRHGTYKQSAPRCNSATCKFIWFIDCKQLRGNFLCFLFLVAWLTYEHTSLYFEVTCKHIYQFRAAILFMLKIVYACDIYAGFYFSVLNLLSMCQLMNNKGFETFMFGNLASIKKTKAAICVYEIRMAWILTPLR